MIPRPHYWTNDDMKMCQLKVCGQTYKNIGREMGLSQEGVRYRFRTLARCLGVDSTNGVIQRYLQVRETWRLVGWEPTSNPLTYC